MGRKVIKRRTTNNHFVVKAIWDEDAEVWVAQSEEVPGLVAEADTRAHLTEKLAVLVPELLELNGYPFDPRRPIDLVIQYRRERERREEHIRLPKAA